jgi:hypothetical protein
MIRRAALLAFVAVLAAAPLRADFDSLVRAVGNIRGLHRVPIPGLGLARFAVWIIHPKGVYDFELATFEGEGGDLDPGTFERLLRQHADAGYRPLVVAHTRRSGELTMIFARPTHGDRVELLLLTHEPHDQTVVLRTVVNIEMLAREISDPRTATRVAQR